MTKEQEKHVADLLWQCIANVRKGQSADWTEEQLKHIAYLVQPPAWWPKDRPLNQEAA